MESRKYLGLAIVAGLGALAIAGVAAALWNDVIAFDYTFEEETQLNVNDDRLGKGWEVSSRHDFNDFDRLEMGYTYFTSTAEDEHCYTVEQDGDGGWEWEPARFEHFVRVNAEREYLLVDVEAPDWIYCGSAESVIKAYVIQGTAVTVDGNPVYEDGAPMHYRDTEVVDCDADFRKYFRGYGIEEDSRGEVSIRMVYTDDYVCGTMSGDRVLYERFG